MEFNTADIQFNMNGQPVSFTIIHDLPDEPGQNIDDCLQSWLARTEDHSADSLCDYIRSRGFTAFTEEGYQTLLHSFNGNPETGQTAAEVVKEFVLSYLDENDIYPGNETMQYMIFNSFYSDVAGEDNEDDEGFDERLFILVRDHFDLFTAYAEDWKKAE